MGSRRSLGLCWREYISTTLCFADMNRSVCRACWTNPQKTSHCKTPSPHQAFMQKAKHQTCKPLKQGVLAEYDNILWSCAVSTGTWDACVPDWHWLLSPTKWSTCGHGWDGETGCLPQGVVAFKIVKHAATSWVLGLYPTLHKQFINVRSQFAAHCAVCPWLIGKKAHRMSVQKKFSLDLYERIVKWI